MSDHGEHETHRGSSIANSLIMPAEERSVRVVYTEIPSDNEAPFFTSSPTVDKVTRNTAEIRFVTNEKTVGMVRFGSIAGRYAHEHASEPLKTEHAVVVEGATPVFSRVQARPRTAGGPPKFALSTSRTMAVSSMIRVGSFSV